MLLASVSIRYYTIVTIINSSASIFRISFIGAEWVMVDQGKQTYKFTLIYTYIQSLISISPISLYYHKYPISLASPSKKILKQSPVNTSIINGNDIYIRDICSNYNLRESQRIFWYLINEINKRNSQPSPETCLLQPASYTSSSFDYVLLVRTLNY